MSFNVFDNAFFGDADQFDIKVAYSVTITEDPMDMSDSLSKSAAFSRLIQEGTQGMFDDQFFGTTTMFDTQSQPVLILSDSLARSQGRSRTLSDTIPMTDSLARKLAASRNLSDAILFFDSLQRQMAASRAINEPAISMTDDLQRQFNADRQLSDDIPMNDDLQRQANFFREMVEPAITMTDAVVRQSAFTRALTGLLTMADQVFASAVSIDIKRLKKASAYIAKRVTEAFISKRDTTGDVV